MPSGEETLDLARRFGETLNVPVFLVDTEGNLLFYNQAAGVVLGRTFEDTGPMTASVWSRIFVPTDEAGSPLLPESLPLMIALTENRPSAGSLWIQGIDNILRHIKVAAFPLLSSEGQNLGAMAVFWELEDESRL